MTEEALDVILIGNAIVDVIAAVDDAFIEAEGAPKGGMTLIDADQADAV
jgi:sugar/nucleoside kinase (ribokinase family)